jgi:predicted membrane GTPase involved in stress response
LALAIYIYISVEGEKMTERKKKREIKKSHREGEIEKERGIVIISKQTILRYFIVSGLIFTVYL